MAIDDDLSIVAEMVSGLVDLSAEMILYGELRSSGRQEKGGGEGG